MILSSVFIAGVMALPSFAAHAAIHRHHGGVARRLNELEKKDEPTLAKRAFNGRMTYYVAGMGACGIHNVASDFIVALNSAQYGGGYPGPNCFKSITISYQGKQVQATITDECPTCGFGELDLSEGLFTQFAGTGEGIFNAEWWFNDGNGGGQQPPPPPPETTTQAPPPPPETTTKAPPPPETTTTQAPPPPPETTTSQPPPPPETTSTKKEEEPTTTSTTSTSSTESTSSSTPTTSSTSSTAASSSSSSSAPATPTDGPLDDLVQITLNLGGLVGAAGALKA